MSMMRALSDSEGQVVVDDDELRIELIATVTCGEETAVALKVTAKTLETVLKDSGGADPDNYAFSPAGDGSLFQKTVMGGGPGYIYCDEDPTLAENEFYSVDLVTTPGTGDYDIILRDLVYYESAADADDPGEMIVAVSGEWTIPVTLDGETVVGLAPALPESISVGDESYDAEIRITPFSLSVETTPAGDAAAGEARAQSLYAAAADMAVILADGTVVPASEPVLYGSSAAAAYDVMRVDFTLPIRLDDVQAVRLFGETRDIHALSGTASDPA